MSWECCPQSLHRPRKLGLQLRTMAIFAGTDQKTVCINIVFLLSFTNVLLYGYNWNQKGLQFNWDSLIMTISVIVAGSPNSSLISFLVLTTKMITF